MELIGNSFLSRFNSYISWVGIKQSVGFLYICSVVIVYLQVVTSGFPTYIFDEQIFIGVGDYSSKLFCLQYSVSSADIQIAKNIKCFITYLDEREHLR